MTTRWLYRGGEAIAYLADDGKWFFKQNGEQMGYLDGKWLFDPSGQPIGCFDEAQKWLYSRDGQTIGHLD